MVGEQQFLLEDLIYRGPNAAFKSTSSAYICWVILAVDQGSFYYEVGEEKGKASFGDLIFCPPGVPLYRQASTPISFYRILFEILDTSIKVPSEFPLGKVTLQNLSRLASNFEYFRKYEYSGGKSHYLQHVFEDLLFLCDSERQKQPTHQDPLIMRP